MYCFTDMCFLCLVNNKQNIQSILLEDTDGILIESKLQDILSEIIVFKPKIPKNICVECLQSLNFVYTFKQKCLENLLSIQEYFENTPESEPDVSVKTEESETDEEEFSEKFQEVIIKQEIENIPEETSDPLSTKTPQNSYECDICNKIFKTSQHLSRHSIVHTGLRPKCDVCLKTFSDESGLNSHKRIHNSIKPYKCSICAKSFTQSGHLSNHMKSHKGTKPFQCSICAYKCAYSGNLKLHMRVHSGERPHMCQFCQMSFSRPESRARHIRRKHFVPVSMDT